MYIVFLKTECYCTLHREYSINITFIGTGKPKNSCDSLYCDIHFIAVIWNRTFEISEVCLYLLRYQIQSDNLSWLQKGPGLRGTFGHEVATKAVDGLSHSGQRWSVGKDQVGKEQERAWGGAGGAAA